LVTYRTHRKEALPVAPPVETIVLREVHPLVWASYPPSVYEERMFDEILSWQEFDCPDYLWKTIKDGSVLNWEDLDGMIESEYEPREHETPNVIAWRTSKHAARKAKLLAYRDEVRNG
jgi:hypothetical protein